MSIIVNIDTTSEKAHVSFAKDGLVMNVRYSESQKEHAAFLQSAIQELSTDTGIKLTGIDAVALAAGPGSYTGLRVGMASAKGLCYALRKPLITINSLDVLALAAVQTLANPDNNILLCPMMDARRMEVFTAVYQKDLIEVLAPCPLILDESSFHKELNNNKILFFGSGSAKWAAICNHANALFENIENRPEALAELAHRCFLKKSFADTAYSEPFYLKDFQILTTD